MHSLRYLIKTQTKTNMSVKKMQLRRPNSLTKAMVGLFKYTGNRAWFARALSYWGRLETIRFGARALDENSTP